MLRLRSVVRVFYVYGLFDECAIIRYIGKGKGERWSAHAAGDYNYNWLKRIFIKRTLRAMGEVPGVKIREGLSEPEAFEIEVALIRAIGRWPNGPLTNLTDNRSGPSSETMRKWWASRTPEERSVSGKKSSQTLGPEGRKARAKKAVLSFDLEAMAQRMHDWQMERSPEERKAAGVAGGTASMAAKTPEQKRDMQKLGMESLRANLDTPEKKLAHFKKTGAGQLTKEQLSANGTKGVTKLNNSKTPEERSAQGRKAAQALYDGLTPEERVIKAKNASKAAHEAMSKRSPEEKSTWAKKVWEARRRNGTINVASIWINNGTTNSRIQPFHEVPRGWVMGKLKKKPSTS